MTRPSTVFAELIRRTQQGRASTFFTHCSHCGSRQRQLLVAETALQEIYRCEGCGTNRVYTVR